MSIFRFDTSKVSVFNKWSSSLPGVATIIFVPLVNLIDSVFLFDPPIIKLDVLFVNFVKSYKTSKIC
jgi:hypothetical protein